MASPRPIYRGQGNQPFERSKPDGPQYLGQVSPYDVNGAPAGGDAATLEGEPGSFYLDRLNHTGTQTAATISDFSEAVDDRVGALLIEGANINLTYDDVANTITVAVDGLVGYSDEAAQDAVGTILTDTATIDFTYSDATPSITADVKTDSIGNTLLANMSADTIKGRANGAGTGDPTDLTAAQVLTILGGTTGTGTIVRATNPTFTDDISVTDSVFCVTHILTDNLANFLTGTNNLEMTINISGAARILSINRSGAVRRNLLLDGLAVVMQSTGVTKLTVDASNATFTVPVVLPSFTVATLPASSDAALAYASNGRKTGEGAGAGTGVPVFRDGGTWFRFADDTAVAA